MYYLKIIRNFLFLFIFLFEITEGLMRMDICQSGWHSPAYDIGTNDSYCYKFKFDSGVEFNWNSAFRSCFDEDAELLHLKNKKEAEWIKLILNSLLNGSENVRNLTINQEDAQGWFFNSIEHEFNKFTYLDPLSQFFGILFSNISEPRTYPCWSTKPKSACYYISRDFVLENILCEEKML